MHNPPESLKALLHKIIDYAGLFPPTKLPLDKAFEIYNKYYPGEYDWMLSNFIIPAKKLDEMSILLKESYQNDKIYPFSILGSSGETEDEFISNLKNNLLAWKHFIESNNGRVETKAFEVKLPAELIAQQDPDKTAIFIESVSDDIIQNIDGELSLFFEGILDSEWKTNVKVLAEAIQEHNDNYPNSGLKLRTGGIEASAFPSPEQVAYTIKTCLDHQIPMKCTAGLHHPVRHFRDEVGTKMHGFLNIFCAGAIAIRHNISEHEMIKLVEEEDPSAIKFTDECFTWDNYEISIEDIEYSRKALLISYGSCSFDEPIDDLKNLKLL